MKEQNKTLEKKLKEMEMSNLPDAEFKILVIRMLNELRGRIDNFSENFNKEMRKIKMGIENIRKNQSEIKNIIT